MYSFLVNVLHTKHCKLELKKINPLFTEQILVNDLATILLTYLSYQFGRL